MQVTQKNSATREEVKNVRSINGLLDELGELTPNEANNLIKSNNCVVRKRAIEYADRQSRLKQLLAEDDSNVEELILSSLGDLTVEEANKLLLEAYSYKVKENAIRYADRQSKLSSLLMETNSNFIDFILSSLGGLTVEEANNLLLEAYYYNLISKILKYTDRQSKIKRLLVEERDTVIDLILASLKKLKAEEISPLLEADSKRVRDYSWESMNYLSTLDKILLSKSCSLSQCELASLGVIPTKNANKLLLYAKDFKIREMVVKYADRQTKLAVLLKEKENAVIDLIFSSLGDLTVEEANKLLLEAYSYKVRENVIRYADRQSKLERLLVEEIIADLIFYSLGDISTEEANKLLLEAGDYNVREMAIKYADRQTKLARLLVEKTSEIIDPILNSLGELTIEEADKLLKAHTLKVIKYAMLNVCSEGLEELRDVIIEKLKYIKE